MKYQVLFLYFFEKVVFWNKLKLTIYNNYRIYTKTNLYKFIPVFKRREIMRKEIEEIIERYFHKEEEYYSSVRYDEEENEFWMKEELKEYCKKNNIKYELTIKDGIDRSGYENEFLAIAYLDENNILQLETVVLECF